MTLSPTTKRAAAAILVAAAAWFLFRTIQKSWGAIRAYPWQVNPLLLAASVVALTAVLAWGVFVWSQVLRRFEHPPVRMGTLQRIWFLSNLARYIPGTVFQFLTAAELSRGAGLGAGVMVASILIHTGFSILSALLVGAWTVTAPLFPTLPAVRVGVAGAGVAVCCVLPGFLNFALSVIPRLIGKTVPRWIGSWGDGLAILALSLVSWALYGGAYYLFVRALTPVSASALPTLAGVNSLSFVAGWVVWILPGGAGVREWAMQGLLRPILPAGIAAIIAIAARLWNIVAELLGAALAVLIARARGDAAPDDEIIAPEDGMAS